MDATCHCRIQSKNTYLFMFPGNILFEDKKKYCNNNATAVYTALAKSIRGWKTLYQTMYNDTTGKANRLSVILKMSINGKRFTFNTFQDCNAFIAKHFSEHFESVGYVSFPFRSNSLSI